ncbi:MAG: adenylosuccinate synthetase [Candidatus Bathyarchaeia archaeon]
MPCTVVVGGFFGDTGKGKIISYLALTDKVDLGARAGVGPNAGHTVVHRGKRYKLRMIPSTFLYDKCRMLVGPGVLVDPRVFLDEIRATRTRDRIGLDHQCAIIDQNHVDRDRSAHLKDKIGTTGSGCGPANADRALRIVKLARDIPELQDFLADVPMEINRSIDRGKNVLIEGTQGTQLSLFHGTYPFVTSKDVTASAACSDVGVGPKRIDEVIVVFKAYMTRVGGGPLKGEISWEEAERRGWAEIATVSGRRRRSAPFNFELAKREVMLNSATQIALTKLDILFPDCEGITSFEDLSEDAITFIKKIERKTGVRVTLVGTGEETLSTVDRRAEL